MKKITQKKAKKIARRQLKKASRNGSVSPVTVEHDPLQKKPVVYRSRWDR